MGKRGNGGIYSPKFTESGLLIQCLPCFDLCARRLEGGHVVRETGGTGDRLRVEELCQGSSLGTNLEVPKAA
jgi:hypothetical protein